MNIQINTPCSKNWDSMTDADGGRYCSFCDKVVVDFTSMNPEEIKTYFLSHCGQKICGHAKSSQMHFKEGTLVRRLLDTKEFLINGTSLGIAGRAALSFVGLALLIAGCENRSSGETVLTGDSIGVPLQEHVLDSLKRIEQQDSIR